MATLIFNSGISIERQNVVSAKSRKVLTDAADKSNNPQVTVTSTIRAAQEQATAMYDNLAAGRNIRYAVLGQQVVQVYNANKGKLQRGDIIAKMVAKITELQRLNQRVSKHCVSVESYAKCNIVDVTTRLPNPRDFVRALEQDPAVVKIITPFVSTYKTTKVSIDSAEPAIHVEIQQ